MRHTLVITVAASLVALSGCGGGGGSSGPSGDPYPPALPNVGDYSVYTSSIHPILPAGSDTSRTLTRTYMAVNADGSLTRVDTASTLSELSTRGYAGTGALASAITGPVSCSYSPALFTGPPRTTLVGAAYQQFTADESCLVSGATTPNVQRWTMSGTLTAAEQIKTSLGTFNAVKYSQTQVSGTSAFDTTKVETCWVDTVTAQIVKCSATSQTVPKGQTTATSRDSTEFLLEAYSFHGQAPVGPVVRRFSGRWNVVFTGTTPGDCTNLVVDLAGQISGNCRIQTSPGVFGAPYSVSGSVNAAGAANLSAANGAAITGTFNSPGAGSGTWVNGGNSGAWTATHI